MKRSLASLRNRSAVLVLDEWRGQVDEHKRQADVRAIQTSAQQQREIQSLTALMQQHQEAAADRKMLLLGKMALRALNLAMARALDRWRERTDESHRQRALMSRVVTRIQNLLLASAFARWRERLQRLQRLIRNCDKAALVCVMRCHSLLHFVVTDWRFYLYQRRAVCRGALVHVCKLLRSSRAYSGMLRRWRSAALRCRRSLQAAAWRAQRRLLEALSDAFDCWVWLLRAALIQDLAAKHDQALHLLSGSDIGKVYQERSDLKAQLDTAVRECNILKTLVEKHEGALAATRHHTAVASKEHQRELRAERESKFMALKLTARNDAEEEPSQPSRAHPYHAPDKTIWPDQTPVVGELSSALGLARAGLLLPASLPSLQADAPPTTPRLVVPSRPGHSPAESSDGQGHRRDAHAPPRVVPSNGENDPEGAASALAMHCGREKSAALARNLPSQNATGRHDSVSTDVLI